ncbi:MAG: SRPBCC family protein [Myxococcales bacterium]|nr:SRPBCC family protein [Myxococcales bacterium]
MRDVNASITIARPRADVARFAMNPDNDTRWIGGIVEARLVGDPPLELGTTVARVAKFLGRRIDYVLEVVGYEPDALLDMRSIKAPFPMRVTYRFSDGDGDGDGDTRVDLDVGGNPGWFFRLAGPLVARSLRKNIEKDLARLKACLEGQAGRD